jgi:hypothetical protein
VQHCALERQAADWRTGGGRWRVDQIERLLNQLVEKTIFHNVHQQNRKNIADTRLKYEGLGAAKSNDFWQYFLGQRA